ncbi:MAG: dockerin type I domain-containing protein, partial [Planctomycetota bacterium]
GRYTLTIKADQIHDSLGRDLDGDKDDSAGGDALEQFFRLYGDTDGDADVDLTDLNFIRGLLGSKKGDGNYLWWLDYNNDGYLSSFDYSQARNRYGQHV